MAASRPGRGPVTTVVGGQGTLGQPSAASERRRTQSGEWRPDKPFLTGDGLKVTMRRAAGLTPEGVLEVPLRFQVPPTGDLRRPFRFSWPTYDTIAAGQRARRGGRQLLEVSIDTLLMDRLVAEATSGVVVWDGVHDPQRVLEELRWISGTDAAGEGPAAPFRLVINQPAVWDDPVVSMVAVLTAVEPVQRPGSIGTEYLSMTFMEVDLDHQKGRQRPNAKPKRQHPLEPGDTLHKIAKKWLHQASWWTSIRDANGIRGVRPSSAEDLAAWAKRHHKKALTIPKIITTAPKTP